MNNLFLPLEKSNLMEYESDLRILPRPQAYNSETMRHSCGLCDIIPFMSTISIRLSDDLKSYLDAEIERRGYRDASELVQSLLDAEKHRVLQKEIEDMLLETADGPFTDWTDDDVEDIRRAGTRIIERRKAR